MTIPIFESPTPPCSQSGFQQSIVPFNFSRGWCMVGDVMHPFSTMSLGPGVYEVIMKMSPIA